MSRGALTRWGATTALAWGVAGTDAYAYVGTSSTAREVSNTGGSGVTTDSAVDAAGRYGLRAGASAAES